MKAKVIDKMEKYESQKIKRRYASAVAKNLMLQLNIQQGSELCFILNQKNPCSNVEAISAWVMNQQNKEVIDPVPYSELLERLSKKLEGLANGSL